MTDDTLTEAAIVSFPMGDGAAVYQTPGLQTNMPKYCVAFSTKVQSTHDISRPIVRFRELNALYSNGAYGMFSEVDGRLVMGVKTSVPTDMSNDWPVKAKKIGAYPNYTEYNLNYYHFSTMEATIHAMVGGDYYVIPHVYVWGTINKSVSFDLIAYPTFMSNYVTRDSLSNEAPNGARTIKSMIVYGYRSGDEKQPWILQMESTNDPNDPFAYSTIDIKPIRPVSYENPEDAYEIFNLRLSEKVNADPNFDMRQLIAAESTDVVSNLSIPVFNTWGEGIQFNAIKVEVDNISTVSSQSVDYMNVTTMANETDTTLNYKTADYALKLTDQTAVKWSASGKFSMSESISYKSAIKATCKIGDIGGEVSEEITMTANTAFEFSRSSENTQTHTEEKTFTVSGQTVAVPAKHVFQLQASWNRAAVSGRIFVYYPVNFQPQLKVIHRWYDKADPLAVNAKMDVDKAVKLLNMPSFKPVEVKDGAGKTVSVNCVWGVMPFHAENSTIGSYVITDLGEIKK